MHSYESQRTSNMSSEAASREMIHSYNHSLGKILNKYDEEVAVPQISHASSLVKILNNAEQVLKESASAASFSTSNHGTTSGYTLQWPKASYGHSLERILNHPGDVSTVRDDTKSTTAVYDSTSGMDENSVSDLSRPSTSTSADFEGLQGSVVACKVFRVARKEELVKFAGLFDGFIQLDEPGRFLAY